MRHARQAAAKVSQGSEKGPKDPDPDGKNPCKNCGYNAWAPVRQASRVRLRHKGRADLGHDTGLALRACHGVHVPPKRLAYLVQKFCKSSRAVPKSFSAGNRETRYHNCFHAVHCYNSIGHQLPAADLAKLILRHISRKSTHVRGIVLDEETPQAR